MTPMDWTKQPDLLEGRTAIVTGAGGGIGRGLACALGLAGANVVIAARRAATGEETAALVREAGGIALAVETDVADSNSVYSLVAQSAEAFGGVDIAIHNASSGLSGKSFKLEQVGDADWGEQAGVALGAAFHLAQACFPYLRDTGRGRFIVLNSSQGLHGGAMNPVSVYSATKSAQRGFVKALAREWGPYDIVVNAVAPAALTDAARTYLESDPKRSAKAMASFPLGRMGDMRDDIGAAVVALCSDYWRYVTGLTVPVDGGYYTAL
jgi:NAD(P)-dependent dehydrogenase (short-subunit alcohol dehydrogenase family)